MLFLYNISELTVLHIPPTEIRKAAFAVFTPWLWKQRGLLLRICEKYLRAAHHLCKIWQMCVGNVD